MRRLAKRAPGPAAMTLLVAAVVWTHPSMAHHAVSHEMLVVQAPWVYADPLAPDSARAFVSLRNRSRHDHALIGAESPVAARVELHVTPKAALDLGDEGPVIPLPARAAVHLGPGTSHIQLHGIQAELILGTSIPLILRFQDDSVLRLQAEVRMPTRSQTPGCGDLKRVPAAVSPRSAPPLPGTALELNEGVRHPLAFPQRYAPRIPYRNGLWYATGQ